MSHVTVPEIQIPAPVRPKREHRTTDIKCLGCGAYNIPENIVCGACGANLPVIYGSDGKVFSWESDSPYWAGYQKTRREGPPASPAVFIAVRVLVILGLFVLLTAIIKRFELPAMGSFIGVIAILVVTVRMFIPANRPH